MRTITVGRQTFTVLFEDLLRPLTAEEYSRLEESIRKHGIKVPVVVDKDGNLIDGFHRVSIAKKLNLLSVPTVVAQATTQAQKRELCKSINADRRQLSQKELQELRAERVERVAAARTEGKSLGVIAEEEGVSKAQVVADLEKSIVQGCTIETPETVVSKDGKKRSAKGKGGKKKPKPETTEDIQTGTQFDGPEEVEGEPESIEDIIRQKNSNIESFARRLTDLLKEMPADPWIDYLNCGEGVRRKVKDAADALRTCKCFCACPKCGGDGCKPCHDTGRVPKAVHEQWS